MIRPPPQQQHQPLSLCSLHACLTSPSSKFTPDTIVSHLPLQAPSPSRSSVVSRSAEDENPKRAPESITVGLLPTAPTSSPRPPPLGSSCLPCTRDSPHHGLCVPVEAPPSLPSCPYITSEPQRNHLMPSSGPLSIRAYCIIDSGSWFPSGRFSFIYTLIILAAVLPGRLEALQGMWPCLFYDRVQPGVVNCAFLTALRGAK